MSGHDYPIEHFQLMLDVSRHLKNIEAQLLTHEYHYDTFGSWWFTFMKNGEKYQVVYDGREFELRFERNPIPEKVHGVWITSWTEIVVNKMDDLNGSTPLKEIQRLLQRGLAKVNLT